MNLKNLRIGAGAGYSGDRIEPAVELAEKGRLDYLVFECLAERTIALAQQRRARNPEEGYDPLLEARMTACLPACAQNGIRVITNMGAANPVAAMNKTASIAARLGISGLKIAAVTGDEVSGQIRDMDLRLMESGEPLGTLRDVLVSANAYLGAGPIVKALEAGADIVITGRVADPALFAAPLIHEFGWSFTDFGRLGKGTVLGHLLECAGQVTGGFFADPGYKEVPNLARLGFPIGIVSADGDFELTKVPGSGGRITPATCKEQLLYEIHDPARYYTPDVVADFTGVRFRQLEEDRIRVTGGSGNPKTGLLKVSVGYLDGFIGEGQMSYGGPGAVRRGQLALDIVRERLDILGIDTADGQFDLIGVNSLYGSTLPVGEPAEVRVRVAVRTADRSVAQKVADEVEALYTNGPAGGGGAVKSVREVMAVQSVLIPAEVVRTEIHFQNS